RYEYYGEFSGGGMTGTGVLLERIGGKVEKRYEGTFLNGVYHGSGKLYADNKLWYDGQFKDGLRSGTGKEYYKTTGDVRSNEVYYEGTFKDGVYHGSGKFYY